MNATTTRLNKMTVPALKEIAKRMGFVRVYAMRKPFLVELIATHIEDWQHGQAIRENELRSNASDVKELATLRETMRIMGIARFGFMSAKDMRTMIAAQVEIMHIEALEMDAVIDEAYAHRAEDVNMTIPAYLAHRASHTKAGEIFLSGFWKAPIADMTKVVVMDDGTRFGVTAGTASYFTGEVYDMPKGEISKCVHCRETVLLPATEEIVSEKKESDAISSVIEICNDAIADLTPLMERAKVTFELVRDNSLASEEIVGIAYQAYADLFRSIEEYQRTIAYAESV